MARLAHCVGLLGIPLVGIWGCIGYFLGITLRQFKGNQHVPRFSDLSVITCDYELQDINTVIIDHAFRFQQQRMSTIYYPTCPRDNYEWSIAKFRQWRVSRDPCFIVDVSVLDPLDPRLSTDILKDYVLEFKVRVEGTLRDLGKCHMDYYKEFLDPIIEDYDEIG